MKAPRRVAALIAALCVGAGARASEPIRVGGFAPGLGEWRLAAPATRAAPPARARKWEGVAAAELVSRAEMVMLARPLAIDLAATPVLCWRWRIDAPLRSADWSVRAGDDFAARVYVGFHSPEASLGVVLRARLRLARALWGEELPDAALNYVWDNRQPVGARRPNATTARAQMIVAESGGGRAGRWVEERADVAADAGALLGKNLRTALLAIASDTDDTGESALAGFADLHFVPRGARCEFPALAAR